MEEMSCMLRMRATAQRYIRPVVVAAFSSHARVSGECSTIHSPPALFFFLKEISSRTLFPLFRPGLVHSGSGS